MTTCSIFLQGSYLLMYIWPRDMQRVGKTKSLLERPRRQTPFRGHLDGPQLHQMLAQPSYSGGPSCVASAALFCGPSCASNACLLALWPFLHVECCLARWALCRVCKCRRVVVFETDVWWIDAQLFGWKDAQLFGWIDAWRRSLLRNFT